MITMVDIWDGATYLLIRSRLLFDKHQGEAHQQKQARCPDGSQSPYQNQSAAQTCPKGKQENYAKVMQRFVQGAPAMGLAVGTQGFHSAAQVADTHGAGKGIAVHLSEGLHLHGAGKGNHSVRQKIPCSRQKTYQKQECHFND